MPSCFLWGEIMKSEILDYIENSENIIEQREYESGDLSEDYSFFDIDIAVNGFIENDNDVCWISSLVLPYVSEYKKANRLKDFSLSIEYIVFWDLMEKCNAFFDNVIKSKRKSYCNEFVKTLFRNGINNGGDFSMAIDIIEKYGVVEDGLCDVKEKDYSVVCYKLTKIVREIGAKIRNEKSKNKINEIVKNTLKYIYYILKEEFYDIGFIKENNIDPIEMKNKVFGKDFENKVVITTVLSDDVKYNKKYKLINNEYLLRKESMEYYNIESKDFKEMIIAQLKEMKCVAIGCDSRNGYNSEKNIFKSKEKIDKKEGFNTKSLRINHCVLLNGLEYKKEPLYFKAINDWNNKGVDIITSQWFDNYIFEALIDKKYINDKLFKSKKIRVINNDFYN